MFTLLYYYICFTNCFFFYFSTCWWPSGPLLFMVLINEIIDIWRKAKLDYIYDALETLPKRCIRCKWWSFFHRQSPRLLQRALVRRCKNRNSAATDRHNAAARLVGGLGRYDHVTPVLRDTLHWLPIRQRVVFRLELLAFDCVRSTCPSYFWGVCTPLTEVSGRLRLR